LLEAYVKFMCILILVLQGRGKGRSAQYYLVVVFFIKAIHRYA
jgi:hypothetical protein